ncbi:hypothetical protein DMUE_2988 [Dictyocoela muelleri]|nr:hypothetical protein DMUE_2988 [Dictyocoela muelleri]
MRVIFFINCKYINLISFVDIAYELDKNRGTVSDYFNKAIEVICEYTVDNSDMIGGYNEDVTSKIVEIDESLFFKRKFNRGRVTNGQWYVGGVEKGTKKAFIIPVLNSISDTMSRIIYENILPVSIIITNQWRAYFFCSTRKYSF